MFAYIKMNYKKLTEERLDGRKYREILGILLAMMLICVLPEIQRTAAAGDISWELQNILGNKTVEAGRISYSLAGEGLSGITADAAEIGGKLTFTLPESSAALSDFVSKEPVWEGKPLDSPDQRRDSQTESLPVLNGEEQPAGEQEDAEQVFYCGSFLCDSAGMIIGCDETVTLTDGVLCLPGDSRCRGVGAKAFLPFGAQISEIYIPANIVEISEGAFDGLTGLSYIYVDLDNPVYGSYGGEIFLKDHETS